MNITKCDKCKKTKNAKDKKDWVHISISGGDFDYKIFDFCGKCANKVIGKIESTFDIKVKVKK